MTLPKQYPNHPDPMDLWLESQGYYRKSTARDSSCLFRAVAEQVYNTQMFHSDVREQCVKYMHHNQHMIEGVSIVVHYENFKKGHVKQKLNLCGIEGSIESYLEHLKNPWQLGGRAEIVAMSHIFKADFLIFKTVGEPAEKFALHGNERTIMLCLSYDTHYDSVYLKEYTKTAGFCQAIVYEILYSKVFGMKEVDYAVWKMIHEKPVRTRRQMGSCGHPHYNYNCTSIQLQRNGLSIDSVFEGAEVNLRELLSRGITPFPYKVAKSLDPNIWRNVEFDVWVDFKRGLKHGYFGLNDELRVGVKCLVKMDDDTYIAHIQEMAPDNGPVVLFVEELGEKKTVSYECLELLPKKPVVKPQLSVTQRSQRCVANTRHSKSGIQDGSDFTSPGYKTKKGRSAEKGKGNNSSSVSILRRHGSGGRRIRTKSVRSNLADYGDDGISGHQDSGMLTYQAYGVNSFDSGYQPYQTGLDVGAIPVTVQTCLILPQQQCTTPLIVPVSPRPEDVPSYWLTSHESLTSSERKSPTGESNSSGSQKLCPSDFFRFVPYSPPDQSPRMSEEECVSAEANKDQSGISEVDVNANYQHCAPSEGVINYNAPKSILEDGTDLPMTDIATLRFFYNLGVDFYNQSQCNVYGWEAYTQSCGMNCTPVCNSSCGSPGLCGGKCTCGPVCITSVPTIHHLLEQTTPPRRQRRDTLTSQDGDVALKEPEIGESGSELNSTGHSSQESKPVSLRFRKDSKGIGKCDSDASQRHQDSASTTASSSHPSLTLDIAAAENAQALQAENNDQSTPTLAYSPPYGYVYYPSNHVVPYSPMETNPYSPFCVQFPEYSPESPQSPHYPNGEVYGTSPPFPVYATSPTPHFLFPASPGIYVGSPPAWTPFPPTTPQ